MLSLRTLIPAVLIALPAFTSAQQQAPYVVECDATDLTTPPSTPLDDWINSLLNVLHDNAKFAFEDVVVGFAQTEQGYDVLEQIWEATASGGAGEKYSLMVPSEEAFAASGLAKPYFSLEATTLYSLFTYHALPVSLGSALNQSTTHTLLETLLPLANGDGAPLVVESNGADALKIASPVEANVKLDSLDEGSSTETLSGLDLYEVDQIISLPAALPTVLAQFASSTSTSAKQSGLALYASALNNTKTVNTLTGFGTGGSKGLTIFAPVDEAFDGSLTSSDVTAWTKVLAGHYSATQTVYSSEFGTAGTKVHMSNGNAITFKSNSSGTFAVSSTGDSSAKILRSDILLQGGGVLHVIDTLLSAKTLQTGINGTSSTGTTGLSLNGGASKNQIGGLVSGLALAVGFFGLI